MTEESRDEIPDEWIPLGDSEGDPHGAVFIDPLPSKEAIRTVRYHADRENDTMWYWDEEVSDLIERLTEYETDD